MKTWIWNLSKTANRSLSAAALIALSLAAPAWAVDAPSKDSVPATTEAPARVEGQTLAEDSAANEILRQEVQDLAREMPERLKLLQPEGVTEPLLAQARLDLSSLQLRQDDIRERIATTQRRIEGLEQAIRDLEAHEQLLRNPAKAAAQAGDRTEQLAETRKALAERQGRLKLEKDNLVTLEERLKLVGQRLDLARQWLTKLEEVYQVRQQQGREQARQDLAAKLDNVLAAHKERASELARRLEQDREQLSEAERRWLETESLFEEEQARLVQMDIRFSEIREILSGLDARAQSPEPGLETLKNGLSELSAATQELQADATLLERKRGLFQQQADLRKQPDNLPRNEERLRDQELKRFQQLGQAVGARLETVRQELARASRLEARLTDRYRQVLGQDLFARSAWPTTAAAWGRLLSGVAGAPAVMLHQVRLSLEAAVETMARDGNPWRWGGFLATALGVLALTVAAHGGLNRRLAALRSAEEVGFSGQVALVLGALLQRNLLGLAVASALLLALWIFKVPQPGMGILATLALLWVGIKIPVNLAWLLLASPRLPPEQRYPRLYRQWMYVLSSGGILAAVTILAHLSTLADVVVESFSRLFMVYLLVMIVPVLKARRFVLGLLRAGYAGRHWFVSLQVFSLLLPLSLFAGAAVGLVGYLNLAWVTAWYLGTFVLVFAGWLLLNGMLKDAVVFLKNYAVARSSYGLLWTQEIIAPLHRSLGLLVGLGAAVLLVVLYGWEGRFSFALTPIEPLLYSTAAAFLFHALFYVIASYAVERTQSTVGSALIRHSRQPMELILPIAAAQFVAPTLSLPAEVLEGLRQVLVLAQIGSVAWLLVRLVSVLQDTVEQRYRLDVRDNLGARRVQTQMRMVRRIVVLAVYVVALSAMLMTFPTIRQFGAGLLASAGVAGLVAGVAARPVLENLIAGIQIGLTQPIRLDDVVVVEGEWGRIAEINSTHVVVRIWDDRQLIVPLNYFNTQPFQNWTRSGTDLLATAFFYVDYGFPVEQGREALKRILEQSGVWDGRAWGLQVTNATDRTLELRALMSAADAGSAWDLRCHVRERFIAFLQEHHRDCLPRTRALLESEGRGGLAPYPAS
jgi:small-conductance mechanosensitive channel